MTEKERKICVVCAWRESCAKKFSLGEGKINCPDFCKDLNIKNIEDPNETKSSKPDPTNN